MYSISLNLRFQAFMIINIYLLPRTTTTTTILITFYIKAGKGWGDDV